MDADVKARYNRERLAIGQEEMIDEQAHTQIVAPVVTRRPEIDSMLADTAYVAKFILERLRKKADAHFFDEEWMFSRQEMKDFDSICEKVLKQAKTEIEIEKHVMSRIGNMDSKELTNVIRSALRKKGVPFEIEKLVLEAIGLSPNT